MKPTRFKSRFNPKETRFTLTLCLWIAIGLLVLEFSFYHLRELTYRSGAQQILNPFYVLDAKIHDVFFLIRSKSDRYQEWFIKTQKKVGVVAIDKETADYFLKRYNEKFPFHRRHYAEFLRRLEAFHPKAIGIDIEFLDRTNPEDDRLFTEALRKMKNVVIGSSTTFQNIPTAGRTEDGQIVPVGQQVTKETLPAILSSSMIQEHVGNATNPSDQDRLFRFTYPWFPMQPGPTPRLSLASQIYRHAMRIPWENLRFSPSRLEVGQHTIPLRSNGDMRINFSFPKAFPSIPFSRFFDEKNYAELLTHRETYDGFTWILGFDGISLQTFEDAFFTPLGLLTGTEIHAHALHTIMSQSVIAEALPLSGPALSIFASLLLGTVLPRARHLFGLMLFTGLVGMLLAGGYWLMTRSGVYLPVFTPLLAIVATYAATNLYQFALETKSKNRIKSLFAGSVSKKVVEAMLDADHRQKLEGMMKGTKVTATIFYSDIRGFTSLSEKIAPQEVFELLNEYFGPMIKVVHKHDGFLDKFIGDCIMAVFSAPEQHPDDPERAVRASLEMQEIIKELQARWELEGKAGFSVGMGINTGEVVLGSLGVVEEEGKWQMTVIGDAVNLAARLYARAAGGEILISEHTYKQVAPLVEVEPLEPFSVKGKKDPVMAYRLLGLKEGVLKETGERPRSAAGG